MKNAKGLTPEIESNTDKKANAWKYVTVQRILSDSGFEPMPIEWPKPRLSRKLLVGGYVLCALAGAGLASC